MPPQLVSLFDMVTLYGGGLASIGRTLECAKWGLIAPASLAGGHATAIKQVRDLRPELDKLPLSLSFKEQATRLVSRLEKGGSVDTLVMCIEELQDNFRSELQQHVFLWIVEPKREMYVSPWQWFGDNVANKYEDARRDMRDCARCFVVDQWSASVFHAMGVMEYGLRDLAARVKVPMTVEVELENWHNIIENIEKQIKAMKQVPKGQQNPVEISFCANAASHFFAVKEAWRNHIAHVRGRYDEDDATRIVTNVRDFMRVMAV